jgi:hypothetical protein
MPIVARRVNAELLCATVALVKFVRAYQHNFVAHRILWYDACCYLSTFAISLLTQELTTRWRM